MSGVRGRRERPWLSARGTNLALLTALLLAYSTGAAAEATGSERGWWVAAAHGLAGVLVVLLIPWKGRVARRGLRRRRATRWLSLAAAALALVTIVVGVGSATGIVTSVAGREALWLHVAAALLLAPLVLWHVAARGAHPRRADLSRRMFLRAGVFGATAVAGYVALGSAAAVLGLPGERRRFTGSHEVGSFEPAAMPRTIWLDDTAPRLDQAAWRLTVTDATGERTVSLDELRRDRRRTTRRATLDCTSGWYSHQDWTGVPLSALVGDVGAGRSLLVRSATGYAIRFPLDGLDDLLLATEVGGQPLSRGHGAPARIVAPGRRGYWWVKWVVGVEVQRAPAWWQPPFPIT